MRQNERVKRPASPSGPAGPGSGDARRGKGGSRSGMGAGRGRRWVPPPPGTSNPPPDASTPIPGTSDQGIEPHHYPWDEAETTHSIPPAARMPPAAVASGPVPLTPHPGDPQLPRKITVTRVAVWRGHQLLRAAVRMFRSATTADGAGTSGLSSLTYATMMNYAADAAIAVALANTLFFAAATAESRSNVALYLLITVAPFAVVAPVIGPLLDRVQRGRRAAMAVAFGGRSLLLVVMAAHLHDWLLYPTALGFMVLSKSFNVLKAAVTPRVLPPEITLVKTNSRISVFGLAAGGVIGSVAAGFTSLFGSESALWFTAVICVAGAWLCLRIPGWVEVTKGETPASLRADRTTALTTSRQRQPMGRSVVLALWGNGSARLLTGFLTLFVAFVIKAQTEGSPAQQLLLLGVFGAAGGAGSFLGNVLGARIHFGKPEQVIVACVVTGLAMAVAVAWVQGIVVATATALVAGTGSALCKVCLDAVIQRDLPEESRASAFGRTETILQLAWTFGGALGVLLPPIYWLGFTVVTALLALGTLQTVVSHRGSSLIPRFGGDRPARSGRRLRRRKAPDVAKPGQPPEWERP